jgi:hypothetical protein
MHDPKLLDFCHVALFMHGNTNKCVLYYLIVAEDR